MKGATQLLGARIGGTCPATYKHSHDPRLTDAGARPLFGSVEAASDWSVETRAMLRKARAVVRDEFRALGKNRSRFGLIHADVTPWNIVLRGATPYVFDFDDCGFGWYLFDVATTLWPLAGGEDYEVIKDAFLAGYRRERTIRADDLELLPVFLMARRFPGLGWIHSRRETAHARSRRTPDLQHAGGTPAIPRLGRDPGRSSVRPVTSIQQAAGMA